MLNQASNSSRTRIVLSKSAQNPTEKVKASLLGLLWVFLMCLILILFLIEFQKIAFATAIGFAIMGFIGFFVKLIHIPINNIIVLVNFLIYLRKMFPLIKRFHYFQIAAHNMVTSFSLQLIHRYRSI